MLGFIADSGTSVGLGHVMRCMTLAAAFAERGFKLFFAIAADTTGTAQLIRQRGFACYEYTDADAIVNAIALGDITADAWVLDSYRATAEQEKILALHGYLFLISDFALGKHPAHIVLDQTLGRRSAEYVGHVPDECCVLTGSEYQLIRPEYFQQQRVRDYARGVQHILVSMGGIDHNNHTRQVLIALREQQQPLQISVLLTSQCPWLTQLQSEFTSGVDFFIDHPAPWQVVASADLAIGAGGTSQWERIAAGLPTLLIQVADNQRDVIHNTVQAGLALAAPVYAQLGHFIAGLLQTPAALLAVSQQCALALSGPGQQQVLRRLMQHAPSFLKLRVVNSADCDVIFAWQQAPGIRQYCRDTRVPEYTGHCLWFNKVSTDPQQHFYIIELFSQPLGYLRLEPAQGRLEVSVLIDQNMHGLGVCTQALKIVRKSHAGHLLAFIKDDNIASQRAFAAAGFVAKDNGHWWG